MTENEVRKLRAYYHALLNQQEVFSDDQTVKQRVVAQPVFRMFASEVERVRRDFPDLLPEFQDQAFLSHASAHERWFHVPAIRAYLGSAIGRLKIAIEVPDDTPVTQRRDFTFVKDPNLRSILERDYEEIQRAYVVKCWKSVIVLSGGSIEAILTDVLLRESGRAKAASKAPKESDVIKWALKNLIEVAVELNLVSAGVERLSHSVRDYRNLVHPGNEIRHRLTFGAEEAKIAIEVLHMLHRDLSK